MAIQKRKLVHHNLHAHALALEQLEDVHRLAKSFPRGYGVMAEQLIRSFTEGRGEAGEVAVHTEAGQVVGIITRLDADRVLDRAERICSMLTRLIDRHS